MIPMQMANLTRDEGIISLLSRARGAINTDMTSTQLPTDKSTETGKVTMVDCSGGPPPHLIF